MLPSQHRSSRRACVGAAGCQSTSFTKAENMLDPGPCLAHLRAAVPQPALPCLGHSPSSQAWVHPTLGKWPPLRFSQEMTPTAKASHVPNASQACSATTGSGGESQRDQGYPTFTWLSVLPALCTHCRAGAPGAATAAPSNIPGQGWAQQQSQVCGVASSPREPSQV